MLLFISGCGSSGNKEGNTVGSIAVGDRLCVQCHSGNWGLTGETSGTVREVAAPGFGVRERWQRLRGLPRRASQHNGVGPIEVPGPFANYGERCQPAKGNMPVILLPSLPLPARERDD